MPKQFIINFNEAGFQAVSFCTWHQGSARELLLEQKTAPLEQGCQNVVLCVANCSGPVTTELLLTTAFCNFCHLLLSKKHV